MAGEESRLFATIYIDTDITPKLAQALRERGWDAISAYEVGNAELSDEAHLEFATGDKRTILTCNARDFKPLFDKWWKAGREHFGIIVSEQLEFGEMLRRVLKFLSSWTADEMRDNYVNLATFATWEEAT